MRVGMMNHSVRPLEEEVAFAAESGFDFLDLTLEPPDTWPPDVPRLRRALQDGGLAAVGHTAWFLPIASPIAELRSAALEAMRRAIDAFAELGVGLVNVHPDPRSNPAATRVERRASNAEAIAELAGHATAAGVTLAVENLGPPFGSVADLGAVLEAAPELGFHLDVGHANLSASAGGGFVPLLDAFGRRLAHVHLSDNHGDADRHLPLGAGSVNWADVALRLVASGYDGTVTLEVFSRERRHLLSSQELWRGWWRAAAEGSP